ncbi:hypothetical protein FNO01nite_12460 [Flavobacterium noncentrifugens]|nr:hypothetical protein FNO01nite_12460 [Flavobacterium noncentrifugens]
MDFVSQSVPAIGGKYMDSECSSGTITGGTTIGVLAVATVSSEELQPRKATAAMKRKDDFFMVWFLSRAYDLKNTQ